MKDFLKPTKKKLLISFIGVLVLGWYSVGFGLTETYGGCIDCGSKLKVNPFLWVTMYFVDRLFPAIQSPEPFLFYSGGLVGPDPISLLPIFIAITIPYWFCISYLISCLLMYFLKPKS